MDRPWSSQLKKGAVELMVLAALQGGEAYGYQLLQRLADTGVLGTTESTLYPVLSAMRRGTGDCAAVTIAGRSAAAVLSAYVGGPRASGAIGSLLARVLAGH